MHRGEKGMWLERSKWMAGVEQIPIEFFQDTEEHRIFLRNWEMRFTWWMICTVKEWHRVRSRCWSVPGMGKLWVACWRIWMLCFMLEEASKKCIQGMFLIKVEESEEQNRGWAHVLDMLRWPPSIRKIVIQALVVANSKSATVSAR